MIRIMFWSDEKQPKHYANALIPASKKARAIELLRNGELKGHYLGSARCRICGERLGSADLTGYGFLWPQKADHYLDKHNLWLPELDALIEAATSPAP